jgi:hypothetical protein
MSQAMLVSETPRRAQPIRSMVRIATSFSGSREASGRRSNEYGQHG